MIHFTPTSASWLNAVEGFFATLTKRRLKCGVLRSIVELQAAINRFLAEQNEDPKPFRWTKSPKKIAAAVKEGSKCWILSTSSRGHPLIAPNANPRTRCRWSAIMKMTMGSMMPTAAAAERDQ
jgi:hypothetical protein